MLPVETPSPNDEQRGPTMSTIRAVKRRLAKLINSRVEASETFAELEFLSHRSFMIEAGVTMGVRELLETRVILDQEVLQPFKADREIWDGTKVMKDKVSQARWSDHISANRKEHERLRLEEEEEQARLEEEQERARLEKDREEAQQKRERKRKRREEKAAMLQNGAAKAGPSVDTDLDNPRKRQRQH
ncbi:hypothetical protein HGRIS_001982 [Hohenbuehelia grisea]|uniref:Uncharacterized protein n=1 Tax=Hohenbuehelia grisea TaxID=104357 RepID=A0ABR3JJ83_9AGAR